MIVAHAYRRQIAATARRVRAEYEAAGSPQLDELNRLWGRLEVRLSAPVARNDARGVEAALAQYENDALRVIREAAND